MSKPSKYITLNDRFQICCAPQPQSQSVMPNSAQKTKYLHQTKSFALKSRKTKTSSNEQFDLSHRRKQENNNFLSIYRMKSLICPVTHLKAEDLRNFSILGTFDKKIIVGFNHKLNLFCFFDQHAMHERIRYEYYLDYLNVYDKQVKAMKEWSLQIIEKDKTNIDVISGIKHSYITFKVINSLDEQISQNIHFSRYGFQIQYNKKQMSMRISKVPLILQREIENKIVLDIAHSLIMDPNRIPKSLQSIVAEISCKSAFKFNDILDSTTIKTLINNLSICQYPFFCVHGRPTLFTRI